jgi:hypothetical protein
VSVEIRMVVEGECNCGNPYPSDNPQPATCFHFIECEWGKIPFTTIANPKPENGDIGHLILTTQNWVESLLKGGPIFYPPLLRQPPWFEKRYRGSVDGERIFIHLEYREMKWTWELFEAHWANEGFDAQDVMIGRWPD